jgi:5-methylcytosine-specific restriction endonuclease McrA
MASNSKALIINADYQPLAVVPLRRAVILVLNEKAEVIEAGDGFICSEHVTVPVPKVVKLIAFVKVPFTRRVPITRRAVVARDNGKCAYCDGKADTIDHVKPRAQGGHHAWSNVVAACRACNGKKAARTPAEAGMKLLIKPFEPKGTGALVVVVGMVSDESWTPYLART